MESVTSHARSYVSLILNTQCFKLNANIKMLTGSQGQFKYGAKVLLPVDPMRP